MNGGLNTFGYVKGNPLKYTDPLGQASISVTAGGTFHYGPGGASATGSVGIDNKGKICFQSTVCGQVGFGLQGGLGIGLSVSESNFCEGESKSEGYFGEIAAEYGGGGSVTFDKDGNVTVGGAHGVYGGGASAGKQFCKITTICFN